MRTYEIDKYTSNIRVLSSLAWLNEPVVCGELIYEINYTGLLSYRLIDHYISQSPLKFDIVDHVFSNKVVSVGNRIGILERFHKISLYNQPNQNCFLPKVFES